MSVDSTEPASTSRVGSVLYSALAPGPRRRAPRRRGAPDEGRSMLPTSEADSSNPAPNVGSSAVQISLARAWRRAVAPRVEALRARFAAATDGYTGLVHEASTSGNAPTNEVTRTDDESMPDAVGELVREGERVRLRSH